MTQPLQIRLNWEGSETIKAIAPVLRQPCLIELTLAANYYNAIYQQFHPDAPPAETRPLDEQGGGELLETLAGIKGLEALGDLSDAVNQARGRVTITRPVIVTIEIPED